jgi:glycosyltransferase involved in cell wall biosynthesis
MDISGFTLVRNALKLDYPFRESVLSILPLCREFVINCGDSDDDTADLCEDLAREYKQIRVFHTQWNRDNQSGGFQLKSQTDFALNQCQSPWCFYIQADEAIHEQDYPKILHALTEANAIDEIDGVVFDYLHFYGSYDYTIRGRNWYRREVRLLKNRRGIEAFRDAQGFRKGGRRLTAIASGAKVYHYGYVRTPESLRQKSIEMAQWWGDKPKVESKDLAPRRHVGLTRFSQSHPGVMGTRIHGESIEFDPKRCERIWDRNEIKNALTLLWESIVPIRIGEFRNYDLV